MSELPERYAYITPVVQRYTLEPGWGHISAYNALVKGLAPHQIAEIAEVYRRLDRQGDVRGLCAWIADEYLASGRHGRERELFKLFNTLADAGLEPFTDERVYYQAPPRMLNWSTLPQCLHFLIEPANKYQTYFALRDRLWREISDRDLMDLMTVAQEMRKPDVRAELDAWLDSRKTTNGMDEWAAMYTLVVIIDDFLPEPPKRPAELDWSILPQALQYLREPACKYGVFWLGVDRSPLHSLTDEELGELAALAMRLRQPQERAALDAWFTRFPPQRAAYPQATLVYHLLAELDHLVLEEPKP